MTKHVPLGDIVGSGSSSSSNSGGVEAPNTLRSRAKARIVELLGEGEIVGLVNGPQSIFFDATPLVNADASYNFTGVTYETREGQASQAALAGNPMAETPYQVELRVKYNQTPPIRTVSEPDATAVRVVVRIPALAFQNKQTGNIDPTSVAYVIEVRPYNGVWTVMDAANIVNQKCTSPYQRAHRVQLPQGGYPWDVRVRRFTPDAEVVELQNETWWESMTVIVDGWFSYPRSALVSIQVDAAQFGNTIPTRFYDVKGLILQVPTNYDPEARTYSGIWDGTFKRAWTNNPAWILYDLLTNNRYGIGEFIETDRIDKWSLYQISQWCDQQVPDGFGGWEPRYTFNSVINSRDEAFKVLQTITTAFRGMAYWSLGQVYAVADMPTDPVKLVTPANVIGGHFEYSGTAVKARHSVAMVSWNDPNDYYRPAVEPVKDDDAMLRFGWRQIDVQGVGITSRGAAYRYGKWILDVERHETETITYEASFDQATLRPGDIIAVADPRKAQVRAGGRLAEVNGLQFTLDAPFEPVAGNTYNLMVALPDGSIDSRQIVSFDAVGGYKKIWVASAFDQTPLVSAMFIVSGTDVAPRQYRVLSVQESEKNIFKVVGLFYDPTKYLRIEQGIELEPIHYTRPSNIIKSPTNLRATESLYFSNGVAHSRISLSWTPSDDFLARGYSVTANTPDGFVNYGEVSQTALDINDTRAGDWTFYVCAVGRNGNFSQPAEVSLTALGWEGVQGAYVSHLEIYGRGTETTFGGPDCHIVWRNNFPGTTYDVGSEDFAGQGNYNPFYRDNVVRIFDVETNDLIRVETVQEPSYIYTYAKNAEDNADLNRGPQRAFRFEVTVRDTLGRESAPAKLAVENPAPDIIIPTVKGGLNSIFVDYVFPNDLDFAGAMIWVSEDQNFDPLTTTPAYDGPNNFVNIPTEPFQLLYVRMAGYDGFGRDSLNICPPIEVTSAGVIFDKDPPAVPSGLNLSAVTETLPTGETQYRLVATWDASPSENFSYFIVEIKRADGNYIAFNATEPSYEWPGLIANETYTIRVKSVSRDNYPSNYADEQSITMPMKTTGPGAPSSLSAVASLKSAFLKWVNPADADLASVEIWFNSTDNRGTATLVGSSKTTAFTHSGLTTDVDVYYWIRGVNTSGIAGNFNATAGLKVTPGQVAEGDIAANAITAEKIRAGEIVGDHIAVDTYLPASITVGETGITMEAMTDPAGLVNQNTTQIQPGKIIISGETSLADWRSGTDQTKIAGGSIATNSIAANSLVIGSRGLGIEGIQFSYDKTTNTLYWTAGKITYIGDDGLTTSRDITASNAQWFSGTMFVGWQKGATILTVATQMFTGANYVHLATYRGTNDLIANYGRTIVDGSNILTGSITANQLYTGELIVNTAQIKGGIILNTHLAGNITFDKLSGGTLSTSDLIRIGGDRFTLRALDQVMVIKDAQSTSDGWWGLPGRTRVILGHWGSNPTDYGFWLYDQNGNYVLGSGGFGSNVIPSGAIQSVDLGQIANRGAFAGLNQIDASNISTYIAGAAIGDAYISSLHAQKIVANSITANQLATSMLISVSGQIGDLVVDNLHVKNGALTQAYSAAGGLDLNLGLNVRGTGRVAVFAIFSGSAGNYIPLGYGTGTLYINRDGINIGALGNNYEASGSGGSSGFALLATPFLVVDAPGTGWHTYRVYDDNPVGYGYVTLMVIELSK